MAGAKDLGLIREEVQRPERHASMTFVICSSKSETVLEPLGVAGVPLRRERNYRRKFGVGGNSERSSRQTMSASLSTAMPTGSSTRR